MSIRSTSHPIDAREWAAQEQGLAAARSGDDGHDDAASRSYRVVAVAVATAPRSRPPPGFAAAVAASVPERDPGFERGLSRGLLLALGAASIVSAALSAAPAWRLLHDGPAAGAMPWVIAAGACVAATWALGQARQLRGLAPGVGAAVR